MIQLFKCRQSKARAEYYIICACLSVAKANNDVIESRRMEGGKAQRVRPARFAAAAVVHKIVT
jgi:hypothetical protein